MQSKIRRIIPVVIVCAVIISIIYLFATVKQPYVICNRNYTDDLEIRVNENISVRFDSKKIDEIKLEKEIRFPNKYLKNQKNITLIKNDVEEAYSYLDNRVKFMDLNNGFSINANIFDEGIILLNNIEFVDNNNLKININSNTKSSSVVSVSIGDTYTEGEFITHLVKNGFSCK